MLSRRRRASARSASIGSEILIPIVLRMSAAKQHQSSHAFSQGRPKGHIFQTVSTHDAAPAERYDYWTGDVIRSFELAAPDSRQRRDFRARMTSLATMAGEMHYADSDA